MFRLMPRKSQDNVTAVADDVILADGNVISVPRGNLSAAKELLAAQKAAQRRVVARRAALNSYQEEERLIG